MQSCGFGIIGKIGKTSHGRPPQVRDTNKSEIILL